MNWTEPRKSQKFSQQAFSACKKIQTTCLNTPIFDKDYKAQKKQPSAIISSVSKSRNCPYHFNTQDHVCLTCRKSICVRCAITYCQGHLIKHEKQIVPTLLQDLYKIYLKEKVDQVQTKLGQSLQRQEYFQSRVAKLIERIQENFNDVVETLNKKKLQIVSYFDQQFQHYFHEYHNYDQILKQKLIWLNSVQREWSALKSQPFSQPQKYTIEKIDQLTLNVKENTQINNAQKRLSYIILGKPTFTMDKLWSEENLERVLYQIQDIPYKLNKELSIQQIKSIQKKKRNITQTSQHQNKQNTSAHKSPVTKNLKASGRVILNKFSSGRKNKQERLQKSQLF